MRLSSLKIETERDYRRALAALGEARRRREPLGGKVTRLAEAIFRYHAVALAESVRLPNRREKSRSGVSLREESRRRRSECE